MKDLIINFCKKLNYKEGEGWCYYNADLISAKFYGKIYSNGDHCMAYVSGELYDHNGYQGKIDDNLSYIPIDEEEEKRFQEIVKKEIYKK